ncbi:MAG: AAA family ATPase [Chloroflexi bacterium]|nr:AAA family ATPase [Chloroflexota bacterium]
MTEVQAGNVVLIVGTSSAGKSSVIAELQDLLSDHYLALGIDSFFQMVAPRWGGGMGGPLSTDGFRYVTADDDQGPCVRIAYGAVGERILRGMHRAVAALAACGNHVLVDEMLLDRAVLGDWVVALHDLPVCVVRLRAALCVLEQREHGRRNPPGLARGHLADNLIDGYDLDLDTSAQSPRELAQTIITYLEADAAWTELARR